MKYNNVIYELFKVKVYITTTKENTQTIFKEIDKEYEVAKTGAAATTYGIEDERIIIIYLRERMEQYSPNERSGIIAHECYHALQYLFFYIGEEAPGEETAAYILQYLVEECLDKI